MNYFLGSRQTELCLQLVLNWLILPFCQKSDYKASSNAVQLIIIACCQWNFFRSVSQSVIQSVIQFVSPSVSHSVSQSVGQCVRQSISQSVSQTVSQTVSQSVSQSDHQSICLLVCLSILQSVSLSVIQFVIKYFLLSFPCHSSFVHSRQSLIPLVIYSLLSWGFLIL